MWKRLGNAKFCPNKCNFFLLLPESLRMFPPILVLLKVCTMPFQLPTPSGGTYEVEVGTPITIPVYAIHHDPQYFPDPGHYDPERFSEKNKNTRHRHSYLPFGDGPRICLGMNIIIILRLHALFSEESTGSKPYVLKISEYSNYSPATEVRSPLL
jgi:hypothetical protein